MNTASRPLAAAWRKYRLYRWIALSLTAAAPFMVPPLVQFVYHHFESVKPAFAVGMIYTAAWLYFVSQVFAFPCPRCGTAWHSKSALLPQACPKCALRRWAAG